MSPVETLIGRRPRTLFPELPKEVNVEHSIDQRQIAEELRLAHSDHRRFLSILSVGDSVYVFDNKA